MKPISSDGARQNVTLSLERETLRKVKMIAARQSTSISGLLARQIEKLVEEDDAYERAKGRAFSLMDQGFHLGNAPARREKLHER